MIGHGKTGFLLLAVLVVAGGAAVWAAYNWLQTPVNATQAEGAVEAKTSEIATLSGELDFSMPPIGSYDAILRRPIFSPSRRAVAGPKVVMTSQDLGAKLVGVVGDGTDQRILLKPLDGGETVRLRSGEDYRGWTVEVVGADEVIFRNGSDGEETLELVYEEAPQPTAKSRRDSRRKQAQQAQQQKQRLKAGIIVDEEEEEAEGEQDNQGQ